MPAIATMSTSHRCHVVLGSVMQIAPDSSCRQGRQPANGTSASAASLTAAPGVAQHTALMTAPFKEWTVLPHGDLTHVNERIVTVVGDLQMPLLHLPRRMSVVRLSSGD